MRIAKGSHLIKKRGLDLHLSQELIFDEKSFTCTYLTGANGLGKTSFIEKIVVPTLKQQQIPFIYIGQDFRIQLYTLRAALAVTTKKKVGQSISELLSQWVDQHRHARVLIADEFDKYTNYMTDLFSLSCAFIHHYILVSHHDNPVGPGASFTSRSLVFRRAATVDTVLKVTVEETATC